MSLNLPSYNKVEQLRKEKFHKSHHLYVVNETNIVSNSKSGIGGEKILETAPVNNRSELESCKRKSEPTWLAFDKMVLSFNAFFQESVVESQHEKYRVRNCKVYFYLEDDTIQVVEEKYKNSGMTQGTILKRHRIKKPAPYSYEYYTVEDFNVGDELQLYSTKYKLVDCDKFTHTFLTRLGVRVNAAEDRDKTVPKDPYVEYRKKVDDNMKAKRPYESHDTLRKFIQFDGKILRFLCYWDDTNTMFGDKRNLILKYYLSNDTIEIVEVYKQNCGRDAVPIFLRRQPLPKHLGRLQAPGMITDKTLLNVFGVSGMNSRYIQDACRLNDINVSNYTDADFRIGASINIMGRNIIIHDCDSFTREFYRLKYNLDMEPLKCETKCYAPKLDMEETIPAHDGIGSAEDSYSSCISLIPKPPQKDFIKFLTLDKNGLESYTLRFNCLLDNVDNTDNKDRRFIISFHLSDDTVEIHQMVGSNSGIQGGRFLQRRKINRFEPKETKTLKDERDYLISQDFYVGARLKIFSHCFLINDADQYTYKYMEENKSKYPKANSNLVLEKLQKIVKLNIVNEKISEACLCSKLVYSLSDINDVKTVAITAIEVKSWLSQKKLDLIDTISAHELITLFREFSNKEKQQKNDYYKDFCLKDIQMYIKSELKNLDYTEYDLIVRYIRNIYESCIITKEELLKTLKACRLPINMDKLNSLCDKYVMEMGPEIDVEEFLKSINWCLDMSNEFGNENDFTPKINNKSIILINEIIEAIFIKKP